MGSETPSWHIGGKAAQTHYYAREQAERIGLPLTHTVTINFASTRLNPRLAVAAFAQLRRNNFNKWATRPGVGKGGAVAPTYVFAFENARGDIAFDTMEPGDPHNVHVHWHVHIPANRLFDFEQQVWKWVEAVAGGIVGGAETIMVRPILTHTNGYLLKGTTKTWAKIYARGQEAKPQGIIFGRRADVSRNLGPSARRAQDRARGVRRQMPSHRPAGQQPGL